jgi:hypothetical protein
VSADGTTETRQVDFVQIDPAVGDGLGGRAAR